MKTTMRTAPPRRRRSRLRVGLLVLVVAAATGTLWLARAEAVPVLVPVYEIETVSNGHRASLLNLPIGQPGVPQVPRPVDVDGDLVPDIQVAVNVVDVSGAAQNPPQPADVLAPHVEIIRDPVAVTLGKPSPPLRVEVRLTVTDSNGTRPDTVVRFGYDTGGNGAVPGCAPEDAPCPDHLGRVGSIPTYFKAVLRGLDDFFNPLTAEVSTRGTAVLGQTINEVGHVANGYDGPLDLVASIGQADGLTTLEGNLLERLAELLDHDNDTVADLSFGWRPWPGDVTVSYRTDAAGQHVSYAHERLEEVDLDTRIATFNRDGSQADVSVLAARVDRLPRRIDLDFDTSDQAGELRYRSATDGRLPDVHIASVSERLEIVEETEATGVEPAARLRARARAAGQVVGADVSARLFLALGERTTPVALYRWRPR